MVRLYDLFARCVPGFLCAMFTRLLAGCGFSCGWIVGSRCARFSIVSMLAPMAGMFGGVFDCGIAGLSGLLFHAGSGLGVGKLLAYHAPGVFASLCWAAPSVLLSVMTPLACMALFLIHPVGYAAAPYTFYWLIPVALCFKRQQSVWCTAVISTFVAHAVGSVIWLYTVPMTSAAWYSIMPMVPFERMMCAAGMVVCYRVGMWVRDAVRARIAASRKGDAAA